MFDLKCKRQGCRFNEGCNCTAKGVHVGRETECQTYEDAGVNKKEKDEIKQTAARKNINVDCRANCLFNDGGHCMANGISVLTNDGSPECSTFMPK